MTRAGFGEEIEDFRAESRRSFCPSAASAESRRGRASKPRHPTSIQLRRKACKRSQNTSRRTGGVLQTKNRKRIVHMCFRRFDISSTPPYLKFKPMVISIILLPPGAAIRKLSQCAHPPNSRQNLQSGWRCSHIQSANTN